MGRTLQEKAILDGFNQALFYKDGKIVGQIVLGDAEEVMLSLPSSCLDMLYLDPPFFTNRVLSRQTASLTFNDRWKGLDEYVNWLERQIRAAYRVLSDRGVIFLHMDWHAVHYARIVMDRIFGYNHFLNEIIWVYKTGGTGRRHFSRKHDNILLYSKTGRHSFFPQKEKSYVKYRYGFSNVDIKRDAAGHYTMVNCRDVWDIPALRGNHPEYLSYPTQKPIALLERMVLSTTLSGKRVGDLFCGSGTGAFASILHGRRCFAVDSSPEAWYMTSRRISSLADRTTYGTFDQFLLDGDD
ncbi:MAG: site-specific DNA-methyltransferase [Methanomassiliicoccales archaeon]